MRRSNRRWENDRPLALGLALSAFVVLMVAAAMAPTWRVYAAVPPVAFGDDRMRLLRALAADFRDRPPDVLLLGGSQMRELFPESAFISRELSPSCATPPSVLNGATSGQPAHVQTALLSHWTTAPSLTVIGLSPWRFFRPRASSVTDVRGMLPLPGSRTNSVLGRLLILPAVASHLLEAVVTYQPSWDADNPFQAAQHRYTGSPWDTNRRIADALWEVDLAARTSDADIDANVRELEALVHAIAARGGSAVFLMVPGSPDTSVAYDPLAARVGALADRIRQSAPILMLEPSFSPNGEDFYDAVHLRETGRRRLWPYLKTLLIAHAPVCTAH